MLPTDHRAIITGGLTNKNGQLPAERLRGLRGPRPSIIERGERFIDNIVQSPFGQRIEAFMSTRLGFVVAGLIMIIMLYIGWGVLRCAGFYCGKPPAPMYWVDFWWRGIISYFAGRG